MIFFTALAATYSRHALWFALGVSLSIYLLLNWRDWFGESSWPVASTVLVGIATGLLGAGVWWFVVQPRQASAPVTTPPASSSGPAVDFDVDGKRLLTIRNRGRWDIVNVDVLVSEYALAQATIEQPTATKLPNDRIAFTLGKYELVIANNTVSTTSAFGVERVSFGGGIYQHDLTTVKRLRFTPKETPVMLPPGLDPRTRASDFRFYALRFRFTDAETLRRYAFTKVIAAQMNPVFPFDTEGASFMGIGSQPDPTGMADMYLKIVPLILAHQRVAFAHAPETDYGS